MSAMAPPKKRHAKAKGRPTVPEPRKSLAGLRGSDAFGEWFEGLVRRERIPASSVIEKALILYARQVGYLKPDEDAPER